MTTQLNCPNCKSYHVNNILAKRIFIIIGGLFGLCLSHDIIFHAKNKYMMDNFPEYPWYTYLKINPELELSFSNLKSDEQFWLVLHLLFLGLLLFFYLAKDQFNKGSMKCNNCGLKFNIRRNK